MRTLSAAVRASWRAASHTLVMQLFSKIVIIFRSDQFHRNVTRICQIMWDYRRRSFRLKRLYFLLFKNEKSKYWKY